MVMAKAILQKKLYDDDTYVKINIYSILTMPD
jgi:hypothetical protein